MSDVWYYQLFGAEFGPVGLNDIAQMLGSGELGSDDMIRHGADGAWVRSHSVPELKKRGSAVAVETAEVADDIDSFMLIDETPSHAETPTMSPDIDSFMLIDEKPKAKKADLADEMADDLADDLDSFRIVDEQRVSNAPPRSRPAAPPPEPPADEPETRVEPNAAVWYFQGLDTVLGPVPRSELVEMVRRSELGPKDVIRKGKKGRWLPSEMLEGLYEEAYAPPPEPEAPPPPPPVSAPPVMQSPAQPAAPPPMESDTGEIVWYCYINDQEYGPMSMTDLRYTASQGSITPQSYIKYGSRGQWELASTLPELFPPPPPPPQPAPVAVQPAAAAFTGADAAGAERNELVQQLLTLLKQGLSAEVLGGGQSVVPMVGMGWYCNISGNIMGPVSIESLVQMVLQKRLFPDDMIRMGTTGEWFPAKTVPDLFPTSGTQKGKRPGGADGGESVMERIDRMYREGQEAQAKADASRPKNESAATAAQTDSSRSAAGEVLRNVSANIARGHSGTFNKPAPRASSGGGSFLGGIELNQNTLAIVGGVAIVALAFYFVPMFMTGAANRTAFGKLIDISFKVKEAGESGMAANIWATQSKDMLKEVQDISTEMKGGSSGSAKRDVSRMARALKEMIETIGRPVAAGQPAGTKSDFERASQAFDEATKAAAKRMGLK